MCVHECECVRPGVCVHGCECVRPGMCVCMGVLRRRHIIVSCQEVWR